MAEKVTDEDRPSAEPAEQRSGAESATARDAKPTAETTAPANPDANGTPRDGHRPPDARPAAGDPPAREPWLGEPSPWLRDVLHQIPSWLVSMVVHAVVLLALALLTLPEGVTDELRELVVTPELTEQFDDLEELTYDPPQDIDVSTEPLTVETEVEQVDVEVSPAEDLEAAAVEVDLDEFGVDQAPQNHLLATVGAYTGDALSGRGAKARAALVKKGGGTPESEKAVAAALKWLAEHQFYDGSWSFNHTRAPNCGGQCRNPGTLEDARIGATAMGLLPFLGAGQTQDAGHYKRTVKNGLYYLITKMKLTPQGGNMWEPGGQMYSHGLASIALCEGYALTRDRGLREHAQQALNFICFAQDPIGGGWRYTPREKGDTSVVGWQVMALKSGRMAYLNVPDTPFKKAAQFLDSVQEDSGAFYGYLDPGRGEATTAVGLLCRMYLGWKKDHPALQRGVQWLSDTGPSRGDMYYDYYATQVMRHWGGDLWKKWNDVMRDQLVSTQARGGHEAGSWYFPGGDLGAERGGRLYCTSMATMVLEVYYRYLPIYRKQSTEDSFPE